MVGVVALLVIGPERLPRVANNIGTFIRKARLSWISLRNTIQSELAEADLSAPLKQAGDELKQISKDLTDMTAVTAVKPADKESADKAPDTSEKEAPAPDPDSKNDDA